MNELEMLEAERKKLSAKINEINDAETKKQSAALVGKSYKVKNYYSRPESWWLYTLVTGMDEDGCLNTVQFERTIDGTIEFSKKVYFLPYDGHIEITRKEFYDAWNDALSHANAMIAGEEQ